VFKSGARWPNYHIPSGSRSDWRRGGRFVRPSCSSAKNRVGISACRCPSRLALTAIRVNLDLLGLFPCAYLHAAAGTERTARTSRQA
jgi:hypothetical protein